MSLVDTLKEQFKALGNNIGQRIQDSPAYAQAADRYENMSPPAQKTLIVFAVFAVLFVLLFIPLSHISESQTTLLLFEEKRNLIRELFKTSRESTVTHSVAVPPTYEGLKSSIESILTQAELLPEQNIGVIEGPVEGRLIPASLVSHVLQIKLVKLNLKQIVDIGSSLVGLSSSVKMKDLLISANRQDTRYYDVTYKLYSLKVPEPTLEPLPEPVKIPDKPKGSGKGPGE